MNPLKCTFAFDIPYITPNFRPLRTLAPLRRRILILRSLYMRADWMDDFPAHFSRDGVYNYFTIKFRYREIHDFKTFLVTSKDKDAFYNKLSDQAKS